MEVKLAAEKTTQAATKNPEVAGKGSQSETTLEPSGRSHAKTAGWIWNHCILLQNEMIDAIQTS